MNTREAVIGYEQLGHAFQARHLAVPMSEAFCLDAETPVFEALAELEARHFDQAPVTTAGELTGFVLERKLAEASGRSTIAAQQVRLGQGVLVSADAPVAELLEGVERHGLLFVVEGLAISGFVTVSDFNKQAARAYLYLLIGRIETGLSDLVRRRFTDDQAESFGFLNHTHARALMRYHDRDVRDNVDADLASYLGLPDLLRIGTGDPEISRRLGPEAVLLVERGAALVDLRNRVMHTNLTLVTRKDSLVRLRENEAVLRNLAARLEIEALSTI